MKQSENFNAKEIDGYEKLKRAIEIWKSVKISYHEIALGKKGVLHIPAESIGSLKLQHPDAAAYIKAEEYIYSNDPDRRRIGEKALERIRSGESPSTVMQSMHVRHDRSVDIDMYDDFSNEEKNPVFYSFANAIKETDKQV